MKTNQLPFQILNKYFKKYGKDYLGGLFYPWTSKYGTVLQPFMGAVQQSEEWKNMRNHYYINCSNIAQAIGIGYESRPTLFKKKVLGIEPKVNSFTQKCFDYGNEHELDGIREYVDWQPNKGIIMRCGCWVSLRYEYSGSPDGIWLDENTNEAILIEIKVPNEDFGRIPEFVPAHYLTQVYGLMNLLNLNKTHFVYWTKEGITIFEIEFNQNVWELITVQMNRFIDFCKSGEEPKRMKNGLKDELTNEIIFNTKQKKIFSNVPSL